MTHKERLMKISKDKLVDLLLLCIEFVVELDFILKDYMMGDL